MFGHHKNWNNSSTEWLKHVEKTRFQPMISKGSWWRKHVCLNQILSLFLHSGHFPLNRPRDPLRSLTEQESEVFPTTKSPVLLTVNLSWQDPAAGRVPALLYIYIMAVQLLLLQRLHEICIPRVGVALTTDPDHDWWVLYVFPSWTWWDPCRWLSGGLWEWRAD